MARMNPLLTTVLTFFLITAGCIGAVEGGYYVLDKKVFMRASISSDNALERKSISSDMQAPVEKEDIENDTGVILRRNLFGPPQGTGTEALEDDKILPQPLVQTTLDLVLMGTIEGEENSSRAIIFNKQDNKQGLFQIGDYIQNALVKDIKRGKIILEVDGEEQILDMSESYKYGAKPPAGPAAVSPSPRKPKALVLERTGREQAEIKKRLLERENKMTPGEDMQQPQKSE